MASPKAELDETVEKLRTLRERVDDFTERLPKLVARHWRVATKHGRDELAPLFHTVLRNGDEHVIAVPLGNPDERNVVAEFIRHYARAHDAIVVAFVSEAWMTVADPSQAGKRLQDIRGTPPSESPDRIEILIANCETPFGCTMDVWTIDRTGKRAKLKKQKRVSKIESRFFGAVPKIN